MYTYIYICIIVVVICMYICVCIYIYIYIYKLEKYYGHDDYGRHHCYATCRRWILPRDERLIQPLDALFRLIVSG